MEICLTGHNKGDQMEQDYYFETRRIRECDETLNQLKHISKDFQQAAAFMAELLTEQVNQDDLDAIDLNQLIDVLSASDTDAKTVGGYIWSPTRFQRPRSIT